MKLAIIFFGALDGVASAFRSAAAVLQDPTHGGQLADRFLAEFTVLIVFVLVYVSEELFHLLKLS